MMKVKPLVFLIVFFSLLLETSWIVRPSRPVNAAEEQALIATIKLRSGDMGSSEEPRHIVALEHELSEAIKQSAVGEFDGDEYGGGVCDIYMYGPSAERLLWVTLPLLEKFHPPAGSYVTKRYGRPGAKEDRIELCDK